jgi:hypothetical protein
MMARKGLEHDHEKRAPQFIFSRNFLFLIIGNQLKFPSESSSMDIFSIQPYVMLSKANDRIRPFVMMFMFIDLPSLSSFCLDQLNDIGQGFS